MGKAWVRYELDCKVSVASTLDEGLVVGMRGFAGHPYDGHTLQQALSQVELLTDRRPELAVVDRGYRGHDEGKTRVLISDTRSGADGQLDHRPPQAKRDRGRDRPHEDRSPPVPMPLKGTIGDAVFAVLNACGHNIRKILVHLRAWLAWIIAVLWTAKTRQQPRYLN